MMRQQRAQAWAVDRGISIRKNDHGRITQLIDVEKGRPIFLTTFNANAGVSSAANTLWMTPYSSEGNGIIVGVWDGGSVLGGHQEFGQRVTIKDAVEVADHATHVAGTVGASGVNSDAKGMAPSAEIHSYDWIDDLAEMTAVAAAAPNQPTRLYLANQSYGYALGWNFDQQSGIWHWMGGTDEFVAGGKEPWFGMYHEETAEFDDLVYNAPYFLPFRAAGNNRTDIPPVGALVIDIESGDTANYNPSIHPAGDGEYNSGYDSIGLMGVGKNSMTVGAVGDAVVRKVIRYPGVNSTPFSGWGPTDDGRIKPDVVANGVSLMSTLSTGSSAYGAMSGTSMASPSACGTAALLVEYYAKQFSGSAMRASTLKGLLIHTADDLANRGPDYQTGWGLINAEKAAEQIALCAAGASELIQEEELTTENPTHTYSIRCDGTEPIRVTLCWTDPAGPAQTNIDSRTPVLVNDLDAVISGPGSVYYPYRLDPENPNQQATALQPNRVDNVEQIEIEDPVPGRYILTIGCNNALVNQSQYYSLLINGHIPAPPDQDGDGLSDAWEQTYFGNVISARPMQDVDGDGVNNAAEFLAGTNPQDATSVFKLSQNRADLFTPELLLSWQPVVTGKSYRVLWSPSLRQGFRSISPILLFPQNSLTETNSYRLAFPQGYYKVEVFSP